MDKAETCHLSLAVVAMAGLAARGSAT